MGFEQDIDAFIKHSVQLIEAYPSKTRLSITYANSLKKQQKRAEKVFKADTNKKATNSVTFKCFEPDSGKCIKYKTYKSKELSKLLTFVGPRGVTLTKKSETNSTENDGESSNNYPINGLSSIMSNVRFEEKKEPEKDVSKAETLPSQQESKEIPSSQASNSNKKKKKKGKK
ncbi:Piso0_000269 [Millerozyma farinosa CBS 7064]|uniref:Piso0_000269 protein n=1 Tax=Pichia sorbitophila (strain ATCC MYA-4447 / BCRC 22081 / CBS 7064 / NBRC 10061 / NRRL Y-12695) TaxID=559304 RepID=G8YTI9_PICSO|nr:Piso0_000269 [Millerozyma farinosa CBS 7064]